MCWTLYCPLGFFLVGGVLELAFLIYEQLEML